MEFDALAGGGPPAGGRGQPYLFAYQPIFDRCGSVIAQELLYRRGRSSTACVEDPTAASATVIVNAFTHAGSARFLRRRRAFINIGEELLLSDLITLLPKELVVIELLETVPICRQVVRRCRQLRALGYTIALDDLHSIEHHADILDAVDLIKVDLRLVPAADLSAIVSILKRRQLILLAEKIESAEEWRHCVRLGFDLFQGYHLARPVPVAGTQPPLSPRGVAELIDLLGDAPPATVVAQALEQDANLCWHLQRLTNSPIFSGTNGIASVALIVALIGYAPLQRWCRLLLFAALGNARHSLCGSPGRQSGLREPSP